MTDRRIVIQKAGDGCSIILHFNFAVEANVYDVSFLPPLQEEGGDWDSLSKEAQRIVRALTGIDGVSCVVIFDSSKVRVEKVRRRVFNTGTLAEVIKTTLGVLFEDAKVLVI
ncbi:MAG TPA: hypothetical protein VLG36_05645 [Candidatus Chromulinivoraceae bacterium]|nr:hypothetical protein [Candidatus Chromulinivoraceae bacterium]